MSDEIDTLRERLRSGDVLAVVGAGVSIGATARHPVASWIGLLNHGTDHCERLKFLTAAQAQIARDEGGGGSTLSVISGAEEGRAGLRHPHGHPYRDWLAETVGKLRPEKPEAIEALRDL